MHPDHYALDAAIAETHWWWTARRQIISHLIDRFAPPNPTRRVLEIGCSTGSNFAILQRYGALEAMEAHGPAAELCQRRYPEIPVYNEAIPNSRDDKYDMICLFDVLEHIEDDSEALRWVGDHLKPEGLVFITVPAFPFLWSQHDELAQHYRRYTRDSLLARFEPEFRVHYATYFNSHLFPVIAAARLLQRLTGFPRGQGDKAAGGQGAVNAILRSVFAAERAWLPALRLPFGVSIFAVASRGLTA